MKVLVAGATGVIGRRLLPMLAGAGHSVTGWTHMPEKKGGVERLGAAPAVVDALDERAVREAVLAAAPEVIVDELTAIPPNLDFRRVDAEFALTNRLRTEGTRHLLSAAREAGCRRFVAQSFAGWTYSRDGAWVKSEEEPLMEAVEPGLRRTLAAIRDLESQVLGAQEMEGILLRYGFFYGDGSSIGRGGALLWHLRKRRLPLIGRGTGYWSFVHVDDAAAATLAAVEAGAPGIYNIVDDEPAPVSEWLPFLARAIGAKAPRRMPHWIGRMAVGAHGAAMMNRARGASNRKAKEELGWTLQWPSWREGFRHGLGFDVSPEVRSQLDSPSGERA